MRGLFIEPFYGGSHKAFADGLQAHSKHEFTFLTLPEGEWRRRMRRGAQELATASRNIPGEFDFLIATDMLDLPTFLALTRPRFGNVPVMLYMHENQFTYPRLKGTKFNSWFGQMNYLSALAADVVAFNSEYHRRDFLGALRSLAAQPNNWLVEESIATIEAKSTVLPVGVELAWLDELCEERPAGQPPLLLWSHRWEFDKAPDVFVRVLEQLASEGLEFQMAVAGDPGLNPHPALTGLPRGPLGGRLRQFGRLEDHEAYGRLLWQSDFAISTTRHEFFGVAMVEAMAAGCIPIAPNRYNYPALVPEMMHSRCLWETETEFAQLLRKRLSEPVEVAEREAMRKSALYFGWPEVIEEWDAVFDWMTGG